MEAEELLKKRLRELARKCYQNNQYTFTGFLGPADMECFYGLERELSYVPYKIWGGSEFCERAMLRFGGEQELGYEFFELFLPQFLLEFVAFVELVEFVEFVELVAFVELVEFFE